LWRSDGAAWLCPGYALRQLYKHMLMESILYIEELPPEID